MDYRPFRFFALIALSTIALNSNVPQMNHRRGQFSGASGSSTLNFSVRSFNWLTT